MRFLNSKQRKHFYEQLREQYGYEGPKELALFEGGNNKIYAITKSLDEVPFTQMRPVQGGLYIASTESIDIRLTLDGAILLAKHCNDCFVDVDEDEKNTWMSGRNLPYQGEQNGYVLLRYQKRIIGCGSVSSDGYIKNYVPKGRRITDPH